MKRNVTLRWLSVMFMTISAVLCRANWVVETEEVDASPGAGLFNAVALDGAGTPMIAYYEATNAVLKGASLNETEMWQTMLLDDNGDVGQHCSGAVDGDGVAHVSYQYRYPYFGQTRGDLKYLCGSNAPVTLDNALGRMGEGTSLALDAAGDVHIAYQAVTLSGNYLKYIARTNGVWSVPQVVEDGGSGVSMALDSSGNPHIAHLDGTDLLYVFWNGGGWTSEVVEDYDVLAGRIAIALDSAGHPHIVFSTTDGLMYARHDGSGWNQECVHYAPVMGEVGLDSPSLTLNEDDEPFISYQGRFGAPAAVVVSRRVYNEGDETWEWLAEAWLQEDCGIGGQTAIAVDGRGVLHVAFHNAAKTTLGYATAAEDTDEDWLPDWWELEYFENLEQGAEDDPDEDDLTNNDEYWGGTDPTVPDEGGGEEDSDGDGLYDEDETFLGTDPYDPDTDGDGMPDGWEFWNDLDPLSDEGDNGASGNPDGDAFTNLQEYEYGLDPQNYGDGDPDEDMDWDYLTNAQEAALGTHPLERDTDGDGLMDGGDAGDPGESQYGTDPLDPDSDDDGLPDGVEVGYYVFWDSFEEPEVDEHWTLGGDAAWQIDEAEAASGNGAQSVRSAIIADNQSCWMEMEAVLLGRGTLSFYYKTSCEADGDFLILSTNGAEYARYSGETDWTEDYVYLPAGTNILRWIYEKNVAGSNGADTVWIDLVDLRVPTTGSDPNDADSDDDGLDDGEEINQYGTYPQFADSDYDGLDDWDEIFVHGTDPLDWDSDDDGLEDGYEEDTLGTDPLDPDSDDDGIPDGVEVGAGVNPLVDDAGQDADSDGLTNLQEHLLGTKIADADTDNDGMPDGWEVDNGLNPLLYDATLDADEDDLSNHGEWQAGTDPNDPDSDDDGLTDGWEVANGLNPLLDDAADDPDADGLTNTREHAEGTDPLADDSDDDGMPDGWEVANGLNPLLDDADSDPDDDSLTNEREYTHGTDPQDADSDDDGLLDGAEVDTHGTNPLDEDSDGDCMPDGWEMLFSLDPLDDDTAGDPDADGLTNVQEYTLGTNPRNADSDADGMPDGWEVAHDLNPLADDSGADPDADGLTNAREYTRGTDPQDADSDNDGLSDGAEVDVRGTDPLDADSDNDGLSDGVEVTTHGTDPLDADTDNDGLSDGAEVATHGTNPLNADTDGDGMPDGWELANGLNPLVDDADDDADGDGLTNLEEYTHGSSAQSADGDSDGLSDWDEIYVYGTNPTDADSDDDGLVDGHETGWGPALEEYFTDGVLPSGWTTSGNSTWTVVDEENYGFGHKAAKSGATGISRLSCTVEIPQPAWLSFAVRVSSEYGYGTLRFKINGQTVAQWSGEEPWPMVDSFSQELQPGAYTLLWEYQVGAIQGGEEAAWLDDVIIQSYENYGTDPLDADSDDDGLNDGDEALVYQTSPTQADSDFDGISDYDELFVDGTNPMDSDTDDDGLADGDEVETYFTDPLDPDTDGDDLSDGAEVNTHSTDPLDADSDDDGMSDGWEVLHNLDPLDDDAAGDADSDGLCNLDEYTYGTNPNDQDSDNDGMYDGEEIHDYGCDPLDADSDGDGVEDGAEATGVGWTLESFEAGVLPAGWTTGGDASWFVQQGEAGHGDYALRSPVIGPSQSAWLELTFYAGPREVSWLYNKTVSASPYLTCTFDGQPVWQGETNGWYGYDVSSTTGVHTLRWEYTKGPGAPSGDDVFRLDRFWMPNPPLGTDPLDPDTDGDGLSDGRETLEEVLDESESFEPPPAPLMMLGAGLLATTGEGAWASSGDAPWTTDTATAYDGIASKRSGTIGDGQQSVLTYTVTTEKGRVSFWYRVSSETAKDGLVFSIDGEPATNWSGSIGWAQASFPVSAGPHVFSWTYVKDAGGAAGDDAAWVDLVERTAGGTGTDPLNADTDDDGMPDGWEVDMGFEPTSGADGDADADGDLLTNAGEYENQTDPFKQDTDGDGQNDYEEVVVTGMDPLDPLSLLKIESLSPVAGGFELKWLSAAGKVYEILGTTNLAAGFEPLQAGVAGTSGRTVFTNAPTSGTRFYRVRVTAP